jgi:protein-S-isoprenylcysteine O-methyltransferase Ste14
MLAMTPLWQQPGAAVAFWALFGLFAVGEGVMRLRSRLHRQDSTAVEPWSQVIVVVSILGGLLGGLGAASVGSADLRAGRWPVFVIGLVLMALGIFVRQWSIFTLGRFFAGDLRVSARQPVIDTGPYRWVRHPSYSGLIIFFVGFGLALTNVISIAVLVIVPTVGLIARIHFEERVLIASLGEPYRRYAAVHKRLVPGVW